LINSIRDQVKKLYDLGVSAVLLLSWIESDKEASALEEGKYSDCIIWHSRVIVEDKVYSRTVCALAIDAWSSFQYVLLDNKS
jgi:delta-aminolevulinic acid dehydratase/porphobilinogen synthase